MPLRIASSKLAGMSVEHRPTTRAKKGDWIEVAGLPGKPSRRGQVEEVVGSSSHKHYRVRWDEQHESLFFPTEGTRVVKHHAR